ncbi:Alpha/Beta hydrolase protein [Infundibulicybe gibba]|nr:Alpha/Beta hydrolase protein [Infundibulicybe gibba]
MAPSSLQCAAMSLLILPPLLLTTYLLAAFPNPPESINLHASLASLPPTAKTWSIYPENFYPGGAYVSFPHGRMRYWLIGPESGKKIVLVHGLSIPAIIWRDVGPELASRGYRVLLYGTLIRARVLGCPQTTYDAGLYATQLALLMQHIKWDRARIAGVSMGGGIAAAFTANFPRLVERDIVLIACAGLIRSGDLSKTSKFMSSPFVQTLASSVPVQKYLQRLTNSTASVPSTPDPILEIVRLQSAHLPGYNAALSSSLRDGPIRGQGPSFSSSSFEDRRVLLFHGTNDNTTRKQSRLITIEGAGHDLTISHPELIVRNMVEFYAD